MILLPFSTAGPPPARLGVSKLVTGLAVRATASWLPMPVMMVIQACSRTIGRLGGQSLGGSRGSVQTTSGVPKQGTTRTVLTETGTIQSRIFIAMASSDRKTCRSSRHHRPPTLSVEETSCCSTSSTRETFAKKYSELWQGIIRRGKSGRRHGYDQRVAVLPVWRAAAGSVVIQQNR